jgi:hypothetical protein
VAEAGANCGSPISGDQGHNLEDDTTGECGFSVARSDLVGADPLLQPLGDNGGLTSTMALAPGSPAIATGGRCLDPTSNPPGAPLATDQRGQPRPGPCDIGAFQSESPQIQIPPRVFGIARVGTTLICSHGVWIADQPLAYTYDWLRNGRVIPGAEENSLRLRLTDAASTLVCQVRAENIYGRQAADSQAFALPPVPRLGRVREWHTVWRLGHRRARLALDGTVPVGTRFWFHLNESAQVMFVFKVRAGTRRWRGVAELRVGSHGGANTMYFDGRLRGRRELRAGVYRVLIRARRSGMRSGIVTLTFTALAG